MISSAGTSLESMQALRALGLTDAEIASDQEVQQLIYLLNVAGADFSYRYKWEVFGPYSVELATEFTEWPQLSDDHEIEFAERTAAAVDHVKEILEPDPGVGLDRSVWLRLLMCVDFASTRAHLELSNGDRPQFLSRNFSVEQINIARAALSKLH